jgi:hypothetical protein
MFKMSICATEFARMIRTCSVFAISQLTPRHGIRSIYSRIHVAGLSECSSRMGPHLKRAPDRNVRCPTRTRARALEPPRFTCARYCLYSALRARQTVLQHRSLCQSIPDTQESRSGLSRISRSPRLQSCARRIDLSPSILYLFSHISNQFLASCSHHH